MSIAAMYHIIGKVNQLDEQSKSHDGRLHNEMTI